MPKCSSISGSSPGGRTSSILVVVCVLEFGVWSLKRGKSRITPFILPLRNSYPRGSLVIWVITRFSYLTQSISIYTISSNVIHINPFFIFLVDNPIVWNIHVSLNWKPGAPGASWSSDLQPNLDIGGLPGVWEFASSQQLHDQPQDCSSCCNLNGP